MNTLFLFSNALDRLTLPFPTAALSSARDMTDLCSKQVQAVHRKCRSASLFARNFLAAPFNSVIFIRSLTRCDKALGLSRKAMSSCDEQSRNRAHNKKSRRTGNAFHVEPGSEEGVCCDAKLSRYEACSCGPIQARTLG